MGLGKRCSASTCCIATFGVLFAGCGILKKEEKYCESSITVTSKSGIPIPDARITVESPKRKGSLALIGTAIFGYLDEIETVFEAETDHQGFALVKFRLGSNVAVFGKKQFSYTPIFGANSTCQEKITAIYPE